MREYVQKVKTLIESMNYVKEFRGKIVVIKLGGAALENPKTRLTIMEDIAMMKFIGIHPVVVHGGGVQITEMLEKLGEETTFVNGLRVTTENSAKVAQMVLAGDINKRIVSELCTQGVNALGICGSDSNLFTIEKHIGDVDLGFVGDIVDVNAEFLSTLINNDFIPIIAPVSTDKDSNVYNVNADTAAIAVAQALKAQKLIFLSNVDGVMRDIFDQNSIILHLKIDEIDKYIEDGIISGGMIVKLQSCREAIEGGVTSVHILDGRLQHSILLEIFTPNGFGTMVEK
ncbi:MAG: acetylglutamate kinase [Synergistaceae bacterium]